MQNGFRLKFRAKNIELLRRKQGREENFMTLNYQWFLKYDTKGETKKEK